MMVKKFVSGGNEKGRVRVKYFEVEVDGDSESLQESIRALTTALSKGSGTTKNLPPNGTTRPAPQILDGNANLDDSEQPDGETEPEEEIAASMSPKPVRQRAKRTPPTPQILDDVGFDEGDPSWPAFAASKPLDNDIHKVTAAAVWFKRVKKVDTVTIDHAYTAFKYVDWPTPDDIGQAFRNAKRTKHWFGTDGEGHWTVNIVGINAIDKLKKGDANS